jgi:hypothetical protein
LPHNGYNVTDRTKDKLRSYCILTGTLCHMRRDYFNIKQSTPFSRFAYYSYKGSPIKHTSTNFMFLDVSLNTTEMSSIVLRSSKKILICDSERVIIAKDYAHIFFGKFKF